MKRLHWKEILKNRIFCVLLAVEILLLLAGIAGLVEKGECFAPPVNGEQFKLEAGTYTVRISYTASKEVNVFSLKDTVSTVPTLWFGDITMSSGDNVEDCEMWVLRDTDTATITTINGGDEALELRNVEIFSTNADSRMFLFGVLIVSALVNSLFCIVFYNRKYGIEKDKKIAWTVLAVGLLFLCVPCLIGYNLWGDDWGFHLLRVEGLINGLQDGQFPVRIQGNWLRGYGYAVSVFYSDFFMVIPMIFRLIGFPVLYSYLMFLVVINVATLLVAYQCFRRCFQHKVVGAITALLYAMTSYRIHNIYMRASVGETLAMVFLPLIFYGFYRIFTDDCEKKNYRRSWVTLTIGLTGVIQSHVLTCEMLAFCILILCMIMIRKVFQKQVFFELVKTVVATLLLNLWYLVPFADYLLTGKFNVGNAETMVIKTAQSWGIYPTHALFLFHGGGTRGGIVGVGMNWTGAFSVGVPLLLMFLLWLYLEFVGDMKKSNFAGKKLIRMMGGFTVLFFVITSCYFPWDALQNLGGISETLIMSMQFPYRFLAIAGLTASVLAGALMLYVKENKESFYFKGIQVLLLGMVFFFGSYQLGSLLNTRGFARVYNKQSMGTIYVSNGEYLPYKAEIGLMQPDKVVAGDGVMVEQYEKDQYTLQTFVYVVNSGAESYVELPILYYKGYEARDVVTGEKFPVEAGENSVVSVIIPAGYQGEIKVEFKEPLYWRFAEVVSVIMAIGVGGALVRKKREVPYEE